MLYHGEDIRVANGAIAVLTNVRVRRAGVIGGSKHKHAAIDTSGVLACLIRGVTGMRSCYGKILAAYGTNGVLADGIAAVMGSDSFHFHAAPDTSGVLAILMRAVSRMRREGGECRAASGACGILTDGNGGSCVGSDSFHLHAAINACGVLAILVRAVSCVRSGRDGITANQACGILTEGS